MEQIVHHFEVFHCQQNVSSFSGLCLSEHAKPIENRFCSKVLAAWAMGAGVSLYFFRLLNFLKFQPFSNSFFRGNLENFRKKDFCSFFSLPLFLFFATLKFFLVNF